MPASSPVPPPASREEPPRRKGWPCLITLVCAFFIGSGFGVALGLLIYRFMLVR